MTETERLLKALEANTKTIVALRKAVIEFHCERRNSKIINPYEPGTEYWRLFNEGEIHGHAIEPETTNEQRR